MMVKNETAANKDNLPNTAVDPGVEVIERRKQLIDLLNSSIGSTVFFTDLQSMFEMNSNQSQSLRRDLKGWAKEGFLHRLTKEESKGLDFSKTSHATTVYKILKEIPMNKAQRKNSVGTRKPLSKGKKAMSQKVEQQIIDTVASNKTCDSHKLMEVTEKGYPTLTKVLERLVNAGQLARTKEGRSYIYSIPKDEKAHAPRQINREVAVPDSFSQQMLARKEKAALVPDVVSPTGSRIADEAMFNMAVYAATKTSVQIILEQQQARS